MFWFGANSERKFDDYRPEVHDSDGLLDAHGKRRNALASAQQRSRHAPPAVSPPIISAASACCNATGTFADYQDLFNFYHQTPSVWVEPRGHWGDGDMHLLELSTQYEGLDNIVAFWDPKAKPAPLQPYHFGYTMYWTRETDMKLSPNKVVLTRVGVDPRNPQWREIIVDFSGPKLAALPEELAAGRHRLLQHQRGDRRKPGFSRSLQRQLARHY